MAKNKNKSAYRPRKKTIRHPILLLVIILVILLGLLWGAKLFIDYVINPPTSTEGSTIEIVPTIRPTDTENNPTTDSDQSNNSGENKTPIQNEGANPNHTSGLSGSITYAAISEDKLIIRVNIDQLVGENGTCSLTLSKRGSKDITKAVNTMDNPSSSTCQGFDIPLKEISKGTWTVKISLSAGGKIGKIEGQVEI